jgi:hypothetical protein
METFFRGSSHQVTVFSDHKNLAYFQDARVLNRHQARWAQFLTRFDFKITYRPGKHQGKADALSRRSYLAPRCRVNPRVRSVGRDHGGLEPRNMEGRDSAQCLQERAVGDRMLHGVSDDRTETRRKHGLTKFRETRSYSTNHTVGTNTRVFVWHDPTVIRRNPITGLTV